MKKCSEQETDFNFYLYKAVRNQIEEEHLAEKERKVREHHEEEGSAGLL